jgi:transmembrane sensor
MPEKTSSELIVRYLSNEASAEEQTELFDWLHRSVDNQKLFNEYCELWSYSYKPDLPFNSEIALDKLNKKIDSIPDAISPKTKSWRIAAAFFGIAISASLSALIYLNPFIDKSPSAFIVKTNPGGQKSKINLVDGSFIQLNANSTLRFPEKFDDNIREVYLEGEAFFTVQRDSLRPFIVYAGNSETKVLGTSFNIQANAQKVEVTVATGKVQVKAYKITESLVANEALTIVGSQVIRHAAALENSLAWKDNILIFSDITLQEASLMLENWYGVYIIFENEEIKKCTLSGKFKNQPLTTVLQAIAAITDIEFEIANKQVKLKGRGCS